MTTTCDNCGVCCFEQGSPPGYLWLMDGRPHPDWPDHDDLSRVSAMPDEALAALTSYINLLRNGVISGDRVCCWLNPHTNRCRWYDYRPQICRDLEVGSDGCLRWRVEYNIDGAERMNRDAL